MDQDLNLLFENAYQLQHQDKLEEAIQLYQHILKAEPRHIDASHCIGLAYAQLGQWHEAIQYFKQALLYDSANPHIYLNLANTYKKTQDLSKAKLHYQQALQLNPKYAQAHNNLAGIYAHERHDTLALEHYKQALHAAPDFMAAHYNLGLLFLKTNQFAAAQKQFSNVIALFPEHADAHFYLGLLALQDEQLEQAENFFQHVLAIEPEHADAWVNSGVIALKRDQGQQAIDCFTRALAFNENHLEAKNNLASTFMHHDRFENALSYYDELLKNEPNNLEYLYNSGVAQMALGHLQEANDLFLRVVKLNKQHFAAFNNLAAIALKSGDKTNAVLMLQKAIEVNPKDASSQFMLNALQGNTHQIACPDYVKNLFNNYALYYEHHVQDVLKYDLPKQLLSMLYQFIPNQLKQSLDLGCGTGLTGLVLKNFCNHLTGVDIAEKMLAQAREKNCYDQLVHAEVVDFLKRANTPYDLITAIDVFPYLGDLEALFQTIVKCLSTKGLFFFTTEISDQHDWLLQDTLRFCHHPGYIKRLIKQFNLHLLYANPIYARQQNHHNLQVMLYVLQKAS